MAQQGGEGGRCQATKQVEHQTVASHERDGAVRTAEASDTGNGHGEARHVEYHENPRGGVQRVHTRYEAVEHRQHHAVAANQPVSLRFVHEVAAAQCEIERKLQAVCPPPGKIAQPRPPEAQQEERHNHEHVPPASGLLHRKQQREEQLRHGQCRGEPKRHAAQHIVAEHVPPRLRVVEPHLRHEERGREHRARPYQPLQYAAHIRPQ